VVLARLVSEGEVATTTALVDCPSMLEFTTGVKKHKAIPVATPERKPPTYVNIVFFIQTIFTCMVVIFDELK
jgi:hypothetical protein